MRAPPETPGSFAHLTDLPPATRALVRRSMQLAVVEGSFTQVFLNWTTGSVLIGFMLHLGAGPTEIALVSSVSALSQVASPLAAYVAAAFGRRRLLLVAAALVSRLTWLAAAAVPAMNLPEAARPGVIIALVLLSSLFLAANTTLWTTWMGDLVPDRERGRTFGLRTGVVGVVGMLSNLAVGAFLDRVGAPVSFQVALVVAVVTGLVGVAIYLLQYDPPTTQEPLRWRQLVTLPWRDLRFRRFLRFTMYWNFVVMLSGPFVTPFLLEHMKMTFTQVAIASSITAVTALFTTTAWGYVADRIGHKRVLAVGTFMVGALLPTGWIVAGLTGVVGWIYLTSVSDAISWGAVRLAAFNFALATAPRSQRVVFIAMHGLVAGIAGFLGGTVSGPLLLFLQRHEFTVFGATWNGYHSLFAIAAITRMQGWWWVRAIPAAPGDAPRRLPAARAAATDRPRRRH